LERLRQRLSIARKAWTALDQVLHEPHSPIVRDASIQRFEFTFEAVWKAAQLYLATVESLESGSPKSAIRECRRIGLLEDEQTRMALRMADDRNLTVHTYNEDLAEEIYHRIVTYAPLMDRWIEAMVQRVTED
jgi:nucleotidyltransferase substrate binding protein (TIGR01987 family)